MQKAKEIIIDWLVVPRIIMVTTYLVEQEI